MRLRWFVNKPFFTIPIHLLRGLLVIKKKSFGKCYLGLVETHIFAAEDQENYIAPIQLGLGQWREIKEEVIGVPLVPKYSFGQVGQSKWR